MQQKNPTFSLDFSIFRATLSALQNAERSPTYDKQAKNPTMRKSYRKCSDVLHGPGRPTPDPYAQERIAAHIRQGKPTAYTYRGKRLISKIDLLEFLGATTGEPDLWERKIKPGANKGKETRLPTELLLCCLSKNVRGTWKVFGPVK